MKSIALLGFLTLTVGACSAKGRDAGEFCAVTADCRDDLVCDSGTCAAPATCPSEAPIDCGTTLPGMCCQTATPVCCAKDATCAARAADCNAPMTCAGRSCATSSGCCDGFTCARFGKTCHAAANLAVGDACDVASQCASKRCLNGYCTKSCAATADCGSANYCLDTSLFGLICVPFCTGNPDCAVFGAGVTCQMSTDPKGLTLRGCFGT